MRPHAYAAAVCLALLACPTPKPPPVAPSPEELLAASPAPGDALKVRGKVVAVTFGLDAPDGGDFVALREHYVLLRNGRAAAGDGPKLWGLGLVVTDEARARLGWALPDVGDEIEAEGTFALLPWLVYQRPVLTALQRFEKVATASPERPRGPVGERCTGDMQCDDALWCGRDGACQVPPVEVEWGSFERDVYGSCATDADCPAGQSCALGYQIADAGDYSPEYFVGRTAGRHVCLLEAGATIETACPATVGTDDLNSGRFAGGKEICVRGRVKGPVLAEDRDTHVQLTTQTPLVYPPDPSLVDAFGSVTENSPNYKDPSLPGGPVTDPSTGQDVVAIGTYRFDPGHGWYEVHPVKRYWLVSP